MPDTCMLASAASQAEDRDLHALSKVIRTRALVVYPLSNVSIPEDQRPQVSTFAP